MKPSIPQPPPRYSERPFPPYRHRPGRTPHPVLDPKGHLFGQEGAADDSFDTQQWQQSESYLYGVDLFNHGYFWEAHEAWEGIWKSAPTGSLADLFLRGLIQLAAAMLQRETGKLAGMRSLSRKGLERLRQVARQESNFCGLELESWIGGFSENIEAGQSKKISRKAAKPQRPEKEKSRFTFLILGLCALCGFA